MSGLQCCKRRGDEIHVAFAIRLGAVSLPASEGPDTTNTQCSRLFIDIPPLLQPLADVTPEEVGKILKVNVEGVLWGILLGD